MRHRYPRTALLLALPLAVACGGNERGNLEDVPLAPVGGVRCADCHPDESARWTGSHHDLAMQVADASTVLGDFEGVVLEHDGETVELSAADGAFTLTARGADGQRRAWPVAYTFGVEPLQQYLLEAPGGRLQASGIAWDARAASEGGQRWFDLSPGEDLSPGDSLHWSGRDQNWNFMCAECHSTGLRKGYVAAEDRYETEYDEIDVACEACHGPGSRHVAWAENDPLPELEAAGFPVDLAPGERSWEIDPGTGLATRVPEIANRMEVETCGRCHARRSPVTADYEFGRPLTDSYRLALLDDRLYHADGQPAEETYVYGSFLQSRMHAAGVSCSDCHDPHGLQPAARGNALCSQCHAAARFDAPEHVFHEPGTPGAGCVDCHMPTTRFMGVDDRHEHAFRVPRPDIAARIGAPDACSSCHVDRGPEWAARELERRFGRPTRGSAWAPAMAAGWAGEPQAAEGLVAITGDWELPGIVRASALASLETYPGDASFEAVRRAVRNEDPLIRLGALRALDRADDETRMEIAYPLLRDRVRSVRLQAVRVLSAMQLERVPDVARARILDGVAELERALRVNADRPETRVVLGLMLVRSGRLEAAAEEYAAALALDPGSIAARVNLADLRRLQGREDEVERLLTDAAEIEPGNAVVWHSLGLARVRRGAVDEAREALRRAHEIAPGDTRLALAYGLALRRGGDPAGAVRVLSRAWRDDPRSVPVMAALVDLARERGDLAGALGWAERIQAQAPQDPGARALVEELRAAVRGGE